MLRLPLGLGVAIPPDLSQSSVRLPSSQRSRACLCCSSIERAAFGSGAGTLFMPGSQPFAAVDFARRTTLIFKVRGDARTLSAMLFSGAASQRMPALASFQATPEWPEVRLPLAAFSDVDLSQLRGLAFTAGLPAGPFTFAIDDVKKTLEFGNFSVSLAGEDTIA